MYIEELLKFDVELDLTKPMYNMLGTKVPNDHKGMIIQNGRKIVVIDN